MRGFAVLKLGIIYLCVIVFTIHGQILLMLWFDIFFVSDCFFIVLPDGLLLQHSGSGSYDVGQ